MENVIDLKGVTKTYRQAEIEVFALRGIDDLEIAKGSFVSISGPSGSGKTTLLNLMGGLDQPSSGRIFVNGKRIDKMSNRELADMRLSTIGFVFQAYNLIPVLSALENVAFVMQLQGISGKERNEKARQILVDVGLEGMEHRRPRELSGGQQQRVAVARAIVSDPAVVLADEPTANLDSKTSESLLELMKKMNQEKGITFVFSTHDSLVMSFAERLISLHDGRVQSDSFFRKVS